MTKSRTRPQHLAAALALVVSGGCYEGTKGDSREAGDGADAGDTDGDGDDGDDDSGGGEPADACGGGIPEITPRALHRLTPLQYRNTIRDLFADPEFEPSYTDAESIPTLLGVRQLRTDAEQVLARRDQWGVDVFGCDVSGAADEACAQQFIATFGARAFRRPLTDAEQQWFSDLYTQASAEFSFADAMDVVLSSIVQAPEFLYLPEPGRPVDGAPDSIRQLTDYELASRLSYLLWNTMPDEALLAAAAEQALSTRDGLREQATRMLADPRAETMVQDFMWSFLQLDGGQLHHPLEETAKDAERFPEYGPALQDAMRTEVEALVRDVYFEDDSASFDRLLTDNRAYVNGALADLYGVSGPMDDDTWEWVELDPDQRAGLLTRAAFLTVFAAANVQTPIRRGTFVVEEMLCSELGSPPPDVDNTPPQGGEVPDGDGNVEVMTVRQEVEARTADAQCQGCHGMINPVGFTFEHYDAIGRWQDDELGSGLPVDSSGELKASDVDGAVADAVELSERLATSKNLKRCFAGRWLYRATGTSAADVSECDRDETLEAFVESGNVRDLVVAIIASDSFRFINTADE